MAGTVRLSALSRNDGFLFIAYTRESKLLKRRLLKTSLAVTAAIGLVAFTIPFLGSLAPTELASETTTRIDVSDLASGTYREFGPAYRRYFLLRDFDGQVRLFAVWRATEGYLLADRRWEFANYPCANFGPDSTENRLEENGAFRCRDEEMPDWYRANLVWDYSGENVGQSVEDLPEEDYELHGDSLVLRGSNIALQ